MENKLNNNTTNIKRREIDYLYEEGYFESHIKQNNKQNRAGDDKDLPIKMEREKEENF